MRAVAFVLLMIVCSAHADDSGWKTEYYLHTDVLKDGSDPHCDKVDEFVDKTYNEPARAQGFASGLFAFPGDDCEIYGIVYPTKSSQLADFKKFISENQNKNYSGTILHLKRILSVDAKIGVTAGVLNADNSATPVAPEITTHKLFSNLEEANDFVDFEDDVLRSLMNESDTFKKFLSDLFTPAVERNFEANMKNSNAIVISTQPWLNLDDGSYEQYFVEYNQSTSCGSSLGCWK